MTLQEFFVATNVRFEHRPDGLGIGTGTPRLSWRYDQTQGPPAAWTQQTYAVEIRRPGSGQSSDSTSHQVQSSNLLLEPWPAAPLRSREIAQVRIAGANTPHLLNSLFLSQAPWTTVEAGLLQASDWKAKFITSPGPPEQGDVPHRPTLYRKTFTYEPKDSDTISRLYISALGLYEVYINGQRVGDHEMAPGWTSYHHRLAYQTFDVSKLLKPGGNTIIVEVAEGWYAGRLLWEEGLRNLYGDKPAFVAQLEVRGHNEIESMTAQIVSDESWSCHPSPRQSASIYNGEAYDAREEARLRGCMAHEYQEASSSDGWQKSAILNFDFKKVALFSSEAPPVRTTQILKAVNVFKSPSGKTLVDFGQNLVGRIKIKGLEKPEGHTITIRHAEVLEHGELGTRPLRNARATDQYIFSGHESTDSEWNPRFTFHGFRYIELTGWSLDDEVPPSADNLSALVLHSDLERTGQFSCSNELVNKLHENVVWSMRGNFLSIPTDCPQRDERLGWTGDIQAFSPTASFLYSSAGFLSNWLRDLALDQADNNGVVPVVIPDVLRNRTSQNTDPVAVWDDAAILVPWTVYTWSGDIDVLKRQWDSMETHIHRAIRRGPDGLWDDSLFQFGDWLDPNAPPEQADLARTDGTLVADAYLVHVTEVMAKIAVAIGNAAAAASYQAEFDKVKRTFQDKYVTKTGLVVGDAQTALALAICFDIVDDEAQRKVAGDRLARLVRQSRFKVSTGFAGTPLVLHALSQTDHVDLAYNMLLEQECPSWLYPVTMGATTIWERWDSMLSDGTINPGSMTSFNHYALGSVANWLHSVVGGLSPLAPGWKEFLVRIRPNSRLTHCEVRFESPYGLVRVQWEFGSEGRMLHEGAQKNVRAYKLTVDVPHGCRALIDLPGLSEAPKLCKAPQGYWIGSGRTSSSFVCKP